MFSILSILIFTHTNTHQHTIQHTSRTQSRTQYNIPSRTHQHTHYTTQTGDTPVNPRCDPNVKLNINVYREYYIYNNNE